MTLAIVYQMSNEADLSWLLEHAKCERDAQLVLGLANYLKKYEIGEAAGYSAGNFRTEIQRRKNLSAAVSRSANAPRIQNLLIEFLEWRQNGTLDIAPSKEVLTRITTIARNGTGTAAMVALKYLHEHHTRRNSLNGNRTPEDVIAELVARTGLENARIVLEHMPDCKGLLKLLPSVEGDTN